MALTREEKKEWEAVLERTNVHREGAEKERNLPQWYLDYSEKVEREEIMIPVESIDVPVKCYISTAKDRTENCPVHINMHGGGFIFPQDGDDNNYCAHVASEIHGIVVDIDYAVSLDHPFPGAFEQSYAVAEWVFGKCEEWNADPKRVSIGGHSAGGCLAAAVCIRAGLEKSFQFCLQVMDYAAIDSYQPVLEGGNERFRAFSMLYADGDAEVLKNPYCSPKFATDEMLLNQPRTLIVNGGSCPFKTDNENYGLRLAANGTEVTIKDFMGSRHGFTIRMIDEWEEAQKLIIRYINDAGL